MRLSDLISQTILEMLNASEQGQAEIKRNELANDLGCVPSQINYVIQTRFTTERGYIVESRRGGGGHIRITRIAMERNDTIRHVINNIGSGIDVLTVEAIVNTLFMNEKYVKNRNLTDAMKSSSASGYHPSIGRKT